MQEPLQATPMHSLAHATRRRPPSHLLLGKALAGYLLAIGRTLLLTAVLFHRQERGLSLIAVGSLLAVILLIARARLTWRDLHRQQWLRDEARHHAERTESTRILIGGLAHDFNNILAVVLGNISITRSELEGRCDDWLEMAERATLRGRDLARQLLVFSKTGRPVKQGTDVGLLVQETARFFLSGAKSRGEVTLPKGESLWPVLIAPDEMSQIIENLIVNADQAMPSGGIIRIRCENLPPQEGDWLLPPRKEAQVSITVEDQGIGIPPERLQKIFEPYFTTKANGNGLGLATIQAIIEKSGGSVSVTSKLNEGTTFTVILPAIPQAVSEPANPL